MSDHFSDPGKMAPPQVPQDGDSLHGMVRHIVDATETADELLEFSGDMQKEGFSDEAELLSDAARTIHAFQRETARLRDERDAAIKMAWELVQELVIKCREPIHKRQLEIIRELHADYILSNASRQGRREGDA